MLFLNTAITALITAASAAPLVHRNQARQNVITASERLGLQWLGGNSSLPKIL
jgi:L-asparaginase